MAGRIVINFNSSWKFIMLTKAGGLCNMPVERANFDDAICETVNLPHTWNAIDGSDGRGGIDEGGEHYYRGLGGYRKKFTLPKTPAASGFILNLMRQIPSQIFF